MKTYKDIDGDSGVEAYDYDATSMTVQFKKGGTYVYTSTSVGAAHLAQMKRLADAGDGLNAYINTNPEVRKGYSRKL